MLTQTSRPFRVQKKISILQLKELLPALKSGHAASTTVTNTQTHKNQSNSNPLFSVLNPAKGPDVPPQVHSLSSGQNMLPGRVKVKTTCKMSTHKDNVSDGARPYITSQNTRNNLNRINSQVDQ